MNMNIETISNSVVKKNWEVCCSETNSVIQIFLKNFYVILAFKKAKIVW